MACVFMGTELGHGLGHVAILTPIAEGLAARGAEVTLAVPSSHSVPAGLLPRGARLIEAPPIGPAPAGIPDRLLPVEVFSDLLATAGMASREYSAERLQRWDDLLTVARPDVVVGNHSPFLMLAARGRHPALRVGTSFELPPDDGVEYLPLPRERRNPDTLGPVLDCVQHVCRERGLAPPPSLPRCFDHAEPFVVTIPELDPYTRAHRQSSVGPLRAPPPATNDARRGVLAYLSTLAPSTFAVLAGLRQIRLDATALIQGQMPRHWPAVFSGISLRPVDGPLISLLRDATLVIHHGGAALCQEALFAGIPQLIVPRYDEQRFNGEAIVAAGTGTYLVRPRPEAIGRAALRLASDERLRVHCLDVARRLHTRWRDGSRDLIVQRCLDAARG